MRARIARLKERALATDEPRGWLELERLKAEVWPQVRDWPPPLRQAALLRKMLTEMPITLEPEALFAGSIEPAFTNSYDLYRGSKGQNPSQLAPPAVRAYWEDDPYEQELSRLLTPLELEVQAETVCIGKRVTGHMVPDFPRVLREGLAGVQAEAEARLARLAGEGEAGTAGPAAKVVNTGASAPGNLTESVAAAGRDEDLAARRAFYQGVIQACEAAALLAGRYREEALRQAADATDPKRRRELEELAARCAQVPMQPARTFAEALQSIWFVYMIMTIEQAPNPYAFSIGRLDQYLLPYYEQDLAAGRLTREDALELLEAFWLKFIVGKSCWAVSQNILLGGVTPDGRDATNAVSYLALEATAELRTPQPSVAVRVHAGTPPEFLQAAARLLRLGLGIPAFHNDETVIPAKVSDGVTLADARDYAIAGCQEPIVGGKENARTTGGKFNLAKCLELALNNGVSTLTGKQLGPATGTPETFLDFAAVREAYHAQVRHFVALMVEMHNRADRLIARERPLPFLSGIMADCLEKGRDVRADGSVYNFTGVLVHGLANVADSLAAIKKLVFEEKAVSMAGLAEALRQDFAGAETLRQLLLNRAPKYGNDEDEVDLLAGEELAFTAAEIGRYRNAWGGKFKAGFNTPSTHVHYGYNTGATPDGRKARESLAYGTGPMQGRTRQGPTALINSVTKFSHCLATNGTDLNLSFAPSLLAGEEGLSKIVATVRTLFARGAHHVQINVVGVETLRAAQADPEAYRDLVVRVHGFSTYFTSLAPEIQEDIIARTASAI